MSYSQMMSRVGGRPYLTFIPSRCWRPSTLAQSPAIADVVHTVALDRGCRTQPFLRPSVTFRFGSLTVCQRTCRFSRRSTSDASSIGLPSASFLVSRGLWGVRCWCRHSHRRWSGRRSSEPGQLSDDHSSNHFLSSLGILPGGSSGTWRPCPSCHQFRFRLPNISDASPLCRWRRSAFAMRAEPRPVLRRQRWLRSCHSSRLWCSGQPERITTLAGAAPIPFGEIVFREVIVGSVFNVRRVVGFRRRKRRCGDHFLLLVTLRLSKNSSNQGRPSPLFSHVGM